MLSDIRHILRCRKQVHNYSSFPLSSPVQLKISDCTWSDRTPKPKSGFFSSYREVLMDMKIATLLPAVTLFLMAAFFPLPGYTAVRTLDRGESPVVLTGDMFSSFNQAPLAQLFVYAYSQGAWKQIPWQFDEVANGHFTATGNGLLDNVDQLVFMGRDTGDLAPAESWIDDADSHNYPRYEITVNDPLHPEKKGWVYIYRSSTDNLAATDDYVDVNETTWLFTAATYHMGPVPGTLRVELLDMNGSGTNVLDRTKIRGKAGFLDVNEEIMEAPKTRIFLNGRVRAIATAYQTGTALTLTCYRSAYSFDYSIDFSELFSNFDWLRLSADFNSAAIGSTYYDANTITGVTVDGSPDSVAEGPATDWWQISGPTGTVVQSLALADVGGTRSNYYKDDSAIDSTDYGDKKSYADLGSYLAAPNANLHFVLWYDILPASQPPVGATYMNYCTHPLQGQTKMQTATQKAMSKLYLLLNSVFSKGASSETR
jgi:hypothetical protein